MEGNRSRQIARTNDRNAVALHRLVGSRAFAIAPLVGRQIHNHRPRFHGIHHGFRHQHGRFLTGHLRRRNHHIGAGHMLGDRLLGATLAVIGDLFGIAPRRPRFLFQGHLDKLAAETLHLLLGFGANVESLHHSSQSSGGRDRL